MNKQEECSLKWDNCWIIKILIYTLECNYFDAMYFLLLSTDQNHGYFYKDHKENRSVRVYRYDMWVYRCILIISWSKPSIKGTKLIVWVIYYDWRVIYYIQNTSDRNAMKNKRQRTDGRRCSGTLGSSLNKLKFESNVIKQSRYKSKI